MRSFSKVLALVASASLVVGSTAAAAASPAQAPAAQAPAPNAWMMLSMLSPTTSVASGGAAAAAQPANVPPGPPAYVPAVAGGAHVTAEFLPFLLWFGLIAIALSLSGNPGRPNSPS